MSVVQAAMAADQAQVPADESWGRKRAGVDIDLCFRPFKSSE